MCAENLHTMYSRSVIIHTPTTVLIKANPVCVFMCILANGY